MIRLLVVDGCEHNSDWMTVDSCAQNDGTWELWKCPSCKKTCTVTSIDAVGLREALEKVVEMVVLTEPTWLTEADAEKLTTLADALAEPEVTP